MVEGALTDEEVSEFEQRLIAAMPPQGPIGNGALRYKLGWDKDRYWHIRNRLLQAGVLVTGRGKGGSVLRVVPVVSSDTERPGTVAPRIAEKDLYDPIVSTIGSHWVPDHQIQDFVIDYTAQQGR
jgi:hypothetical protein